MKEKKSTKNNTKGKKSHRKHLHGVRAFVRISQVPYMHMLDPLALCLTSLKGQSNLKYPIKMFEYMKNKYLQKTFNSKQLKTESMSKFLIRGYQHELNETQIQKKKKSKFPSKFNLTFVRSWFQGLDDKESFLLMIQKLLINRQRSDEKICQRFSNIINMIVNSQRKGEIKVCKSLFENVFKRIRIPWTKNVYAKVREHGESLFQRFCVVNPDFGLNYDTQVKKQDSDEEIQNLFVNYFNYEIKEENESQSQNSSFNILM